MADALTFNQWLQSRLTAHGFPVGPVDGEIGKNTIAALEAFQKKQGLAQSGRADALTVAHLRESASQIDAPQDIDRGLSTQPIMQSGAGRPEPWPRQKAVPDFYGAVGSQQVLLDLPFEMILAWDRRRKIRKISLHAKVHDSAARAFAAIDAAYGAKERRALGLDVFGGSLNVRRMRGGSAFSMHSWGIAIDFDPERNQLKWTRERARLAQADCEPFWQAWEKEGWISLGREKNFDWMHVQAARL